MNLRAQELIAFYQMQMLAEEDTYIAELYRSPILTADGLPSVTTTYGLYCHDPESHSNFHVLTREEVWSFYEGDPINLFLLYPDGSTKTVILGKDQSKGQVYQFTIPVGVYQGAELLEGEYALYGCTVAPGFTPECFTKGNAEELIKKYPSMKDIILKLN